MKNSSREVSKKTTFMQETKPTFEYLQPKVTHEEEGVGSTASLSEGYLHVYENVPDVLSGSST